MKIFFVNNDGGAISLGHPVGTDDVGNLGFALGQGAGLVQHHRVDPGRGLQRERILE